MNNHAKQRNLDVDKRFDEVLHKLNHMTELMIAKKPDSPQPTAKMLGWEVKVETRKQQLVFPNPSGKNKEVMRDEGEWTGGSSFPMQRQKGSPLQ
jgi:hypothetical protein